MQIDLIANHLPGSTALIQGDRTITYGELVAAVGETAAGLRAVGVGRNDRVGLIAPNDVAFVTGYLAIQAIGAVVCPISHRNPPAALEGRIDELAPSALVVSSAAAEGAIGLIDSGAITAAQVGTVVGDPSPDLPPFPAGEPVGPIEVEGTDTAVILHTSGIVGRPRAAVVSHGSMAAARDRIVALGPGLTSSDITLAALPFPHVLGLNMCLLPSLRVGATLVLQPSWNAEEAVELVGRHRVTHLIAVPPMWATMAGVGRSGGPGREAMASVTYARSGASTLHPTVADAVFDVFGIELAQGYGLTETAGTVTIEPAVRRFPGSVGRPLPDVELKLVEDGEEVEPGDRGEVWIRTKSLFDGYLDDAPATAEVLISDGWLRTGDIGIQDDDGTLYLIGRDKDLINVSGFNVFPIEVEDVIERHPDVAEAVVVGEPHEISGERVIAYVTSAPGSVLDVDGLLDHCRDYLPRYKVPASIHLVDRLPLTATGKRVRKELRQP